MKKRVFREKYNETDKIVKNIWNDMLNERVEELAEVNKTKKTTKKKVGK